MLEVSNDICRLFNADRPTLYAVSDDRTSIVSKVKTGLKSTQDLKLPIGTQSIAGYVAMAKQMVNIADVYDINTLKKIHPDSSFLQVPVWLEPRYLLPMIDLEDPLLRGTFSFISQP